MVHSDRPPAPRVRVLLQGQDAGEAGNVKTRSVQRTTRITRATIANPWTICNRYVAPPCVRRSHHGGVSNAGDSCDILSHVGNTLDYNTTAVAP